MSDRGFTLTELLIACLLLMAVTAAIAALAVPARNAFDRTLGAADLSGGSRAALERMMHDVREAGSSAAIEVRRIGLADVMATAVPLVSLDDPSVSAPARALRITRIGLAAPQGVLSQTVGAGATTLQLDTSLRCAKVGLACGFAPGMPAVIFDTARSATVSIGAIGVGGFIQLTSGLPTGFEPGAIVAAIVSAAYGLRSNADGSQRLVRISPGGAEQPILQNVVDFDVHIEGRSAAPQRSDAAEPWPTYGPAPPALDQDDLRDAWGAGENCTIARDGEGQPIPRLATLASDSEPVPLTTALITDGPWCADVSDSSRYDADLLRVSAIEVRLRVEAASAVLRGPAGRLFRRPGTERNASRWVPDVELRLTVRIRNVVH